jgi:hypothetical protein
MNAALIGIFVLALGQHPARKDLGTALQWYESIDVARAQAKRENRLVLALHVSGHFDDPALT